MAGLVCALAGVCGGVGFACDSYTVHIRTREAIPCMRMMRGATHAHKDDVTATKCAVTSRLSW